MIYRFTLVSDEVEDFVRVIDINPESTFEELHNAIVESVNYAKDEITSFFICDEDWQKQTEVSLIEKECDSAEDNWVMSETKLSDLLEEEGEKLLYEFDILAERYFDIELTEIITGKEIKDWLCVTSSGNPPKQSVELVDPVVSSTSSEMDELFSFDQEFDPEDFDPEGFDITED